MHITSFLYPNHHGLLYSTRPCRLRACHIDVRIVEILHEVLNEYDIVSPKCLKVVLKSPDSTSEIVTSVTLTLLGTTLQLSNFDSTAIEGFRITVAVFLHSVQARCWVQVNTFLQEYDWDTDKYEFYLNGNRLDVCNVLEIPHGMHHLFRVYSKTLAHAPHVESFTINNYWLDKFHVYLDHCFASYLRSHTPCTKVTLLQTNTAWDLL